MINGPLVSIVTPTLNAAKFLEECLLSVLDQTYKNIEHIIVDGGSTDDTLGIVRRYSTMNPGKISLFSERDEGVGEAVNRGFQNSSGQILTWLDADDLFEPDAVMTIVQFFNSHRGVSFVFGGCDIIDESGKTIGGRPVKDFDLREAISDRHYIFLPAVFYRREVVEGVGSFNTLGNDLDFYLRAAGRFELKRIKKTLAQWRRHQGSITFSKLAKDRQTDRRRFREDYVICRRYGGSILAPRCRRYFMFSVLDKLGIYLFVCSSVLPRLRRQRISNKILKVLGA